MAEPLWHYEPAADLDKSMAERLRQFPREPDLLIYALRSMTALAVRAWLRSYHRLQIVGRENLPSNGSFIMVANHASHLDALCLLAALPLQKLHRAFPAAAQDYFFVGLPRVAVATILVNAMPFARQAHMRQSLDLCRNLLANPGNVLLIFPEGTRSTTGQLGAFRPGIGYLLAGMDVPVVPCALQGTFSAWPRGAMLPTDLLNGCAPLGSLSPGSVEPKLNRQTLRVRVQGGVQESNLPKAFAADRKRPCLQGLGATSGRAREERISLWSVFSVCSSSPYSSIQIPR